MIGRYSTNQLNPFTIASSLGAMNLQMASPKFESKIVMYSGDGYTHHHSYKDVPRVLKPVKYC